MRGAAEDTDWTDERNNLTSPTRLVYVSVSCCCRFGFESFSISQFNLISILRVTIRFKFNSQFKTISDSKWIPDSVYRGFNFLLQSVLQDKVANYGMKAE